MDVKTIKMSSRGQIVIPQEIREELCAKEGTIFAIFGRGDTIILKKLEKPSKEMLFSELKSLSKNSVSKIRSKKT